jgi:hypothetical protein
VRIGLDVLTLAARRSPPGSRSRDVFARFGLREQLAAGTQGADGPRRAARPTRAMMRDGGYSIRRAPMLILSRR